MNKQEIIDKLFEKLSSGGCRYPKWELSSIINPFLEVIKETMESGNEVRLTHFGKFVIKTNKGRKFYNINSQRLERTSDKKYVAFVQSRFLNLEKSPAKPHRVEPKKSE